MSAQVSLPSSVLTDTKSRNEITGDWDIAFFENFAVYDCKFWDYYSVNEKGDRFDITLRSNGYSPTTMISGTNHSLSPALMEMAEKRISLSIVKEGIRELNQKYLDIENRNQQSIKSSGMSLGESLFRKFTEPYKGKIILVDFWGTWCMPCMQALSKSQEEYKRLSPYDIVYMYFANNSPEAKWKDAIKQYQIKGDNVIHFNLEQAEQKPSNSIFRYIVSLLII